MKCCRIGVIYVAEGREYSDLARQSAISLRTHEPTLPILLFTDQVETNEVFDEVRPIPDGCKRAKIGSMAQMPFEYNLFLDCDTLVVQPLGDLFEILDRFDLALCHDVRRSSELIERGWREKTPYAFPQMNSGVMLFKRSSAMISFFAKWAETYETAGLDRDQITLKDLLWKTDIRLWVLPPEFNLRRVTVLDAWEPLDAVPTIIHSHRLLQHINTGSERVTDLETLLAMERTALSDEWRKYGLENRNRNIKDPSEWFRISKKNRQS